MIINNISRPIRFTISSSFAFLPKLPSPPNQYRKQAPMTSATENNSAPISSAAPVGTDSAPSYADVVVGNDDVDAKFGFKRPEMYQSSLAGSVTPYERHVFLCYNSHESWPPRVESSDEDSLPKSLATVYRARKDDVKVKTLMTVCEGREDLELSDGDVLIFPGMIKYRGLKESDMEGFFDDVLVNGKPWAAGVQEVLTGSYVFVCAHNNRDRRCGVCGPILIEKFKEEIESKNLNGQVFVTACSHIGGHKYAGNVIIFSTNAEGEIAGHWFGYVTPDDVSDLLDRHIGKGEIIERIWRGQMGAVVDKTDKVPEVKLSNGSSVNYFGQESVEKGVNESSFTCCQGANGVSCCGGGDPTVKKEQKEAGNLTRWIGKWDQRDVLTTIAVVGAVTTVAVAFAYFRKSR